MATKCDEEFDLIKFSKGEAAVWSYFNVKQHKISKKVIDNVAVCLKCGLELSEMSRWEDKSHKSRASRSSAVAKLNSFWCRNSKRNIEVKKLDGTLMSLFGKKCGCNTKRAKNTTDKIARFIIKDLRPYSIVDFSSHKLWII